VLFFFIPIKENVSFFNDLVYRNIGAAPYMRGEAITSPKTKLEKQ